MRITDGEANVLHQLSGGKELVQSIPGGWWIDHHQVSGKVCWNLLRKILIRETHSALTEDYFVYEICEERGRAALFTYEEVRDKIKSERMK